MSNYKIRNLSEVGTRHPRYVFLMSYFMIVDTVLCNSISIPLIILDGYVVVYLILLYYLPHEGNYQTCNCFYKSTVKDLRIS